MKGAGGQLAVIGGGFFGCSLALYAMRELGFASATVFEEAGDILTRASYYNQARVHNGYHYPRSFTTGFRSRASLKRFVHDYEPAIDRSFTKLYAIAAAGSKVTGRQFERFCAAIEAPIRRARAEHEAMFDRRTIESVFEVEEFAFDSKKLAALLKPQMEEAGVAVRTSSRARVLPAEPDSRPRLLATPVDRADGEIVEADWILNCTYGRLTACGVALRAGIKYEVTELALVEVPEPFRSVGITVMDGPFFSVMPFPARTFHSFSHVRYTPHFSWTPVADAVDPYERLRGYAKPSSFDRMVRDACRFVPGLADCREVDSHFEVKAVLTSSETDDGRPILFERAASHPRIVSVLGGKLDNIYDAQAAMAALVG